MIRYLNYILQFLFIRVVFRQVRVIDQVDIFEVSMCDTGLGIGGKIKESHFEDQYLLQYCMIPFTNKYVGKQRTKMLRRVKTRFKSQ